MNGFRIESIGSGHLPEIVRFLQTKISNPSTSTERYPTDLSSLEKVVRWLVVENPAAQADGEKSGFCVRDTTGVVRGLNLFFPSEFRLGDKQVLGLCGSSLFVDEDLRTAGFLLFKKFLTMPGHSLFFSTTCNSVSAALWKEAGGAAIPSSDREYWVPLRTDSILAALAPQQLRSGAGAHLIQLAGRVSDQAFQRFWQRASLRVEPCRDWEKLSWLSEHFRPREHITSARSPSFLEWRYRHHSAFPAGVYLVRDKCGREGWFSLGSVRRGPNNTIRGCVLLDAVWPRDRMRFTEMFRSAAQLVRRETDLISFRVRPGIDLHRCALWALKRTRAAPSSFVIGTKQAPLSPENVDFASADGDSVLPII